MSFAYHLMSIQSVNEWKAAVNRATLYKKICYYYFAEKRLEPFLNYIPQRYDRIYFVKKQIKKLLPKKIMDPKLFFYLVEKYGFFNPTAIDESGSAKDDEQFFEAILRWNQVERKIFLKEHPIRKHKKIVIYERKPIRC